jgi:hypothetical protein
LGGFIQGVAGGELLGGGSVGFGVGNLGVGGGGVPSSTFCVGDGNAGFLRVFEFSFAFSLIFGSIAVVSSGLPTGDGDAAALLALTLVMPPAGIPDSA